MRLAATQVMLFLVRAFSPIETRGPIGNLRVLGEWLHGWGAAPTSDFDEFVRVLAWQQASRQIARLEGLQKKYANAPQFWRDDVASHVGMLHASVARRDYAVPVDLELAFGANLAGDRLRQLVTRFGELLEIWPDLREAARHERASGNPIGRRI